MQGHRERSTAKGAAWNTPEFGAFSVNSFLTQMQISASVQWCQPRVSVWLTAAEASSRPYNEPEQRFSAVQPQRGFSRDSGSTFSPGRSCSSPSSATHSGTGWDGTDIWPNLGTAPTRRAPNALVLRGTRHPQLCFLQRITGVYQAKQLCPIYH